VYLKRDKEKWKEGIQKVEGREESENAKFNIGKEEENDSVVGAAAEEAAEALRKKENDVLHCKLLISREA